MQSFKKRNIFFWIFFLLLIVALPLTVFLVRTRQELRKKALGGPARLFLNPSLGNFTPGSDLFIEIYLDSGGRLINSFQILNLQFDPNVLEPTETTVSLEGTIPNFTQQVINSIDSPTGKIKFARGVDSTNPSYFNGLGKIGLIKLRVKSSLDPNILPLTTEVNFINESSVLITKVVEAETSQDILGTKTGGIYTIINISPTVTITPGGPTFTPTPSGPTPTSSLTPIPTQTPTPTRTPTPTSGQGGPPTPTSTPTPILSEAILLGKVVKKEVPNCTDSYYYLGTSCGNSTCYGPPGFSVSFNQPNFGRSDSVGDDCVDGPRYTFESRSKPMGSQNGENAQVSLRLDNPSGYTGSWQWEVHTTNGSGDWLAGSQQTGVNAMVQDTLTINLKIYSVSGYKWNHLWFYYAPAVLTQTPTPTPTSTPTPSPRYTPTLTPAFTPTVTPTPTPVFGPVTFNISAVFQAVYSDANISARRPKEVRLYLDNVNEVGESRVIDVTLSSSGSVLNDLLVFSNDLATVQNLKRGTYDISLKGPLHLTRSLENISIAPPETKTLDFTAKILLGGDVYQTNDAVRHFDLINDSDYEFLRARFATTEAGADIDFNDFVNIQDYTILAGNAGSPRNIGERCQIKGGRYCPVIIP